MSEYKVCTINGEEHYLNDVLVDIPELKKEPFIFEMEGRKFKAYPENAIEYCMDYSRDSYSQAVERNGKNLEGLLTFIDETGDIIKEID